MITLTIHYDQQLQAAIIQYIPQVNYLHLWSYYIILYRNGALAIN